MIKLLVQYVVKNVAVLRTNIIFRDALLISLFFFLSLFCSYIARFLRHLISAPSNLCSSFLLRSNSNVLLHMGILDVLSVSA